MNDKGMNRRARIQLLLVALVFVLPLAAAWWMYYSEDAPRPEGRTNHGALLTPVKSLADELPGSPLVAAAADHWALVYLLQGACEADCEDALYRLRQTRLMLGNDMNRLQRVLLHGTEAPDTLFLEREHAGLTTLSHRETSLLLDAARPGDLAPGGLYLLDPLGNLVMYFPADVAPRELVDDLEHLLELSRIG